MKIANLKQETNGSRCRIAAEVYWEECDRPTQEVYFEVDEEFGEVLACDPHPFLVAAIMPALWYGETRVVVEGEICPELRAGLMTAMSVIHHWYRLPHELVRIEAKTSMHPAGLPERAGFFFTGGIDSLATLRGNRLDFALHHPGAFKDGLVIFGLEVDTTQAFEHVVKHLSGLAQQADLTVIPVYTNERYLEADWDFWRDVSEGAVLAAAAHALGRRLTAATIASSYDIPNLPYLASHPMLDPFYSSYDVRIRHDGAALSRFEKTRLLVGWDLGLQHIRVCNQTAQYQADRLNCGQCEKCLRTMLALLAVGALEKTAAFPSTRLSEEVIRARVRLSRTNFRYWQELIAPLEAVGRHDLARGVRYVLARYHGEIGWKGALKRFDQVYLHNRLRALKHAFLPLEHRDVPTTFTGAV
jgi:hypothetical protein